MTTDNLARNDDESLKVAAEVFESTEVDLDSRSKWDEMHSDWLKLYFQNDPPLNPPWEGSSDESIPLLTEGCNQFQARAYQAFFPNNNIIKAVPTANVDPESIDRAERVGKHMSWQLMVKDRTYKKNKDALLLSVPLHGCAFTKTYYDPILRMHQIENVRATDLILPYSYGPQHIDKVARKTQIIWKHINEAKVLASSGYFADVPEVWEGADKSDVDQSVDEAEGVEEPYNHRSMCKLYEQHGLLDLNGDGIAEPVIMTICAQSKKLLRLVERSRGNMKYPVHYFTQYDFLPNPDGTYGLGLGHLVGKINKAVNKMLRQTIDAGSLENVKSGFVSDALDLQGGELAFRMGEFQKINATGRISDQVHEMKFSGPSAAIIQAVTLLLQRGDRLQTVTEALTGQTDKVLQPTAMLALIEQGLQVYSSVFDRLITSWTEELRKVYDLNAEHLDLKEYFAVQDSDGLKEMEIWKEDYGPDLQIMPIADPKMSTEQQKMARADAEWAFAVNNPLIAQNPESLYVASKRYLTTMGAQNIDEILPKPQQKEPEREDDPLTENFYALMPVPEVPAVFADQDHKYHLAAHDSVLSDETWAQNVTKEGRAALEAHVQMHKAFAYAEMTGVLNGLEGPAGDPGISEGLEGEVPGGELEAMPDLGSLVSLEGTAGSA